MLQACPGASGCEADRTADPPRCPVRDVLKISHPSELTRQQVAHTCIAFGEDLEDVPVGSSHDVADASDEIGRDVFVEQVAHRVDEDLPRPFPVQRLLQLLGHESEIEALFKRVSGHTAKALSEDLRIAELAAGAHLCAASDRVPSRVGPLNRRPVAHRSLVATAVLRGPTALTAASSRPSARARA